MVEGVGMEHFLKPWSLALLAILGSVLYVLLVVAYRLTLHPLAGYPGPFFARITDWYNVYYCWSGTRHLEFYRIHQKYGKIVRFGPDRVSINSNEALKAIYGSQANTQKSAGYSSFRHFFKSDSTQTIVDKAQHARKRRVLSFALSDKALRAMEEPMLSHARKFFAYLRDDQPATDSTSVNPEKKSPKEWASAKNVADWFGYLSFDTMGSIIFGSPFDMMDSVKNHYIIDVLADGAGGLMLLGHMPMLLTLKLDQILFPKLVRDNKRYEAYSKGQSDRRIKQEKKTESKDVFQFLLEAKDPESGEGFSMPELVSESSLLIIAGSDTSATAMAGTLFYLLHNPATLESVNAEVRAAFDDVEQIRAGGRLNGCRYLRACIDEAMRLSPPVGGIMPREVMIGGVDIDGYHIPAGMDVGTPMYAIHHNELYYPEPFAYRPSRWIADSEEGVTADSVSLALSAFCPFSLGPRGCVGKAMAYMEMTIVLARLLWSYEMRLAPGYEKQGGGRRGLGAGREREDELQLIDKFVSKADGPMVEFKAR
ncbi:MAG: hypothetical protein M4579_004445 [Chaenotheca gracillima]|nr:MAG: hypothetical protein M4579_004445 [Chaenotheca gracillima]